MKIYLFKKTVFDCRQATLLALKREAHQISLFGRAKLFYHLLFCVFCRRFVAQSAKINEAGNEINNAVGQTPAFQLSDEKKASIQKELDLLAQ